jgi:L-cysteine desulfidase
VQPNIQDRIREKASECIGELEGLLDEYIISKFTSNPKPYGIMHTLNIKGVHTNRILEHWKRIRAEYDNALTTEDELIKEGYSNFSKTEIKKIVGFCDSVITDAMKVVSEANKTRKPRQRKQKSPEQLVSKLKYLDKHEELVSENPKDIIGALQLWVYNIKSRKLGCYNAEDASGLSVKGSSIISFNESKSTQKKLRKPEVTLPEVLKGGKVYLRTALDDIKAVSATLNGRLNTDTILLRIIK